MTDPSALEGLHRIESKRADGIETVYFSAWRDGPRMVSTFGTPEFEEEFWLLHREDVSERRAAAAPTPNKLFDAYQDSQKSRSNADRTREGYVDRLDTLHAKFGGMLISDISIRHRPSITASSGLRPPEGRAHQTTMSQFEFSPRSTRPFP